jgi:hypothetical protein
LPTGYKGSRQFYFYIICFQAYNYEKFRKFAVFEKYTQAINEAPMKYIATILLFFMTIALVTSGVILWKRRKETGDYSILDVTLPYLGSQETGSVKEHVLRSLELLWKLRARKGNNGSLIGSLKMEITDACIISKKPVLANGLFELFAEILQKEVTYKYR